MVILRQLLRQHVACQVSSSSPDALGGPCAVARCISTAQAMLGGSEDHVQAYM